MNKVKKAVNKKKIMSRGAALLLLALMLCVVICLQKSTVFTNSAGEER